jgi:hypothetical protein
MLFLHRNSAEAAHCKQKMKFEHANWPALAGRPRDE